MGWGSFLSKEGRGVDVGRKERRGSRDRQEEEGARKDASSEFIFAGLGSFSSGIMIIQKKISSQSYQLQENLLKRASKLQSRAWNNRWKPDSGKEGGLPATFGG